MTSSLEGEGSHGQADEAREVAPILEDKSVLNVENWVKRNYNLKASYVFGSPLTPPLTCETSMHFPAALGFGAVYGFAAWPTITGQRHVLCRSFCEFFLRQCKFAKIIHKNIELVQNDTFNLKAWITNATVVKRKR